VDEFGAPMDVLWFRLSKRSGDSEDPVARFEMGRIFIMLNRGDYWQCGYVIPKGSLEQVRERGLPAFRDSVAQLAPFAADRVGELQEWGTIKPLTSRSIGCLDGIAQASSASAMRRTRCPRSAAWASTSRSRMRSLPRICWRRRYARAD
jgi:hypothetical protein